MQLLVDCGNTRLKWAYAGAEPWQAQALVHAGGSLADIAVRAWKEAPRPDAVWVACVAGEPLCGALAQILEQRFGVAPRLIRAEREAGGVTNRYARPEQLGADRWAALIGARALTDDACVVVDCGTAVTLDALNASGEFIGGVIAPGLKLARASLAHATPALNVAPGDADSCLARATADAIAAGTRYGIAGAIERIVREFEHALGPAALIITGGDAPLFAPLLEHPVRHEPDLVLHGLARIAGA